MTSDPLIISAMQRSAALAHDARERAERIDAMEPESPTIADEDRITAHERAAIKPYLAAYAAWRDQADQAEADAAEAHAAYRFAHRLGTGRDLCEAGAEVMSHVVTVRGAAAICEADAKNTPPTTANTAPPIARHARPREAGRPARRSTRSSAASGDSGDDGPEPPAAGSPAGSGER